MWNDKKHCFDAVMGAINLYKINSQPKYFIPAFEQLTVLWNIFPISETCISRQLPDSGFPRTHIRRIWLQVPRACAELLYIVADEKFGEEFHERCFDLWI